MSLLGLRTDVIADLAIFTVWVFSIIVYSLSVGGSIESIDAVLVLVMMAVNILGINRFA